MAKDKNQEARVIEPVGACQESLTPRLAKKNYIRELRRLQVELVKLQSWVRQAGMKIVVVFEGRDAAGKGGIIKRLVDRVSPRVFKVVALPKPSEKERSQLYMQRYIGHLPSAGEVVIFDRSWYNRAGVERVMGFCTEEEYRRFLRNCPTFEQAMVDSGILLVKYWLTVSHDEQARRFQCRIDDPLRRWKLSPMDLESLRRWYDYSRARDAMFAATDTDFAPWHVVRADDKRRARLNCISHLLSLIDYDDLPPAPTMLPDRERKGSYDDDAVWVERKFVPERY